MTTRRQEAAAMALADMILRDPVLASGVVSVESPVEGARPYRDGRPRGAFTLYEAGELARVVKNGYSPPPSLADRILDLMSALADDNGEVTIGLRTIARTLATDTGRVSDALTRLARAGRVVMVAQYDSNTSTPATWRVLEDSDGA